MTPTAQTLCRDIAKLKWGESETHYGGREHWHMIDGRTVCVDELPFLTDPAETVRMLKELLKQKSRNFAMGNNGEVLIDDFEWGKDFEHAVAEAYKAMLLAKKEHGRGEEEGA